MSLWYPCVYCTEDLHCAKYTEPGYESWCVLGPCTAETPSNGDRIRRMSDEELTEWVKSIVCKSRSCGNCPFNDWCNLDRGIADWLKSPVEGDK